MRPGTQPARPGTQPARARRRPTTRAKAAQKASTSASVVDHPTDTRSECSLGERGVNFVKVLAENDRLPLLPEIGAQFETLKAQAEGTLEVTITSAQELTQAQVDDLVAGLKAKFNRAVNVQVAVDPELIGGAVITIGDQVIDGSVKGRLQRMSFALQA